MDTIQNIQNAIDYIEEQIDEQIAIERIAEKACMSVSTFRRLFLTLCGVTVGEYVRMRKLTLAGQEIISTKDKIVDIAFKYGYESHESFSRAFLRFHNVSPLTARNIGIVNSFAKISVESIMKGNEIMGTNWFFQSENSVCNFRSAGVLIQDGKILVQREKGGNEYALPGGLVLQGETTQAAFERRFKEETNAEVICEKLIWVEEAFWEWNNKKTHSICFYYLAKLKDAEIIPYNKFICQEGNANVEYGWIDLDTLGDLTLYPTFAKSEVFHISNQVKHFVSVE